MKLKLNALITTSLFLLFSGNIVVKGFPIEDNLTYQSNIKQIKPHRGSGR
jgi:hypothetical protein